MIPRAFVVGERFGRWITVQLDVRPNYWFCLCDCGATKKVKKYHLFSGGSTSCGCFRSENAVAMKRKHGATASCADAALLSTFRTWVRMKQRCNNPKNDAYPDYGGRGIDVCQAWNESFDQFLTDMGTRPYGLTLERKRNGEGYGPLNCIWDSKQSQANNRRSNAFIEFDGQRQTIAQWSRVTGISQRTIWARINTGGWHPSRALTEEVRR